MQSCYTNNGYSSVFEGVLGQKKFCVRADGDAKTVDLRTILKGQTKLDIYNNSLHGCLFWTSEMVMEASCN